MDQTADVGASPSQNLQLISHEIILNYFRNIPTYVITVVPQRHNGRTDRRTDNLS